MSATLAVSRRRLLANLVHLSPSYFGMVMATGILAIGALHMQLESIGVALLHFNIFLYLLLWVLYLLRICHFPHEFMQDFTSHKNSFGFFTLVAASSIMGCQLLEFYGSAQVASVFLGITILLWLLLTYVIFALIVIKKEKPSLMEGINGGWLLAVVATQSIAVLSGLVAARSSPETRLLLNFLALSTWLFGGMLYIWMMSLIFYRYTFFQFQPTDLAPPYWINMGAMAISTLAGCVLYGNVGHAPFLHSIEPFIKGFTVFYWATGTWWIPMLLVLGVWRYIIKRSALSYDPLYWGGVFPMGMYAVSTFELLKTMHLPFLVLLPKFFLGAGLLAWLLTFIGVSRSTWRLLKQAVA